MTAPRPVFPGQFLVIQRRCTQRQFLLRPDEHTNNAFVYLLAEASQRFNIQIILPQMMSNHHHTVAYDPDGRHVEFREHFHKLLAKSQNALRGRWENLWSTEEPCIIEVIALEDLLKQLVYVATNPVEDGLVDKVHHWPGPNFVQALLSGKPMKATRPLHFFREHGSMPAEIELTLGFPAGFVHTELLLAELRRRIAEVEDTFDATVEVVAVGDRPLDEPATALLAAAREAMVNAARFAAQGGPISVYAEVKDAVTEVFVRDRGPGFDLAAVPVGDAVPFGGRATGFGHRTVQPFGHRIMRPIARALAFLGMLPTGDVENFTI